jgi:hypothetical protein
LVGFCQRNRLQIEPPAQGLKEQDQSALFRLLEQMGGFDGLSIHLKDKLPYLSIRIETDVVIQSFLLRFGWGFSSLAAEDAPQQIANQHRDGNTNHCQQNQYRDIHQILYLSL